MSHPALDRLQQVLGFQFLDGDLRVSRHSERVGLDHRQAGEQGTKVAGDHLVQPDKGGSARAFLAGNHGQEAGQRPGQFHPRKTLLPGRVAYDKGEVQAHVGDVRERSAGVHGKRSQDREDYFLEVMVHGSPLRVVKLLIGKYVDPRFLQQREQLPQAGACLKHQLLRLLADGLKLR